MIASGDSIGYNSVSGVISVGQRPTMLAVDASGVV